MATTAIYPLSLHAALPICEARPRQRRAGVEQLRRRIRRQRVGARPRGGGRGVRRAVERRLRARRSEEHTSELQSQSNLVCRLLLEKKKTTIAYFVHRPSLK